MPDVPIDFVAELHRQTAFGAAILGGFAVTFLGALLSVYDPERRVGTWAIGFTAAAAILLLVATLAAIVVLLGVLQFGLTHFDFSRWPPATMRAKWVADATFFVGIYALVAGVGLSGWARSRATGYVTSAIGVVGLALLTVVVFAAF